MEVEIKSIKLVTDSSVKRIVINHAAGDCGAITIIELGYVSLRKPLKHIRDEHDGSKMNLPFISCMSLQYLAEYVI